MAKLMLSWMAQKYGAKDLKTFRTEFTRHCLVWEPGAWRPPSKGGSTVVTHSEASDSKPSGKPGDALAILLEAKADLAEITLGRDSTSEVLVDDATVSGKHLTLIRKGEAWFVRNPGSTNGTWLNDQALAAGVDTALMSTDRLRVGMVHLTYYDPKGLYFRLKAG